MRMQTGKQNPIVRVLCWNHFLCLGPFVHDDGVVVVPGPARAKQHLNKKCQCRNICNNHDMLEEKPQNQFKADKTKSS